SYSVAYLSSSTPPSTLLFFFQSSAPPRDLPSFPTRRSSDLADLSRQGRPGRWSFHSLRQRGGGGDGQISHDLFSYHGINYTQNRSEEHTSELQSLTNLVCRLLLEKKKKI